jgi:hypothetical protein
MGFTRTASWFDEKDNPWLLCNVPAELARGGEREGRRRWKS